MFGNLEGLTMCRGDDVAWHLFGVGGEFDMHGVNFQGQTLEVTGNHVNAKVVLPGTAMTLTSTPDTVGKIHTLCCDVMVLCYGSHVMLCRYKTIRMRVY